MDDEPVNAQAVKDDIVKEQKQSFAAVPIHFRPGEGKSKLIKLVIPGIEPPLGFFEVSGGSPEDLTLEERDGPSDDVSGDSDPVEDEVQQTETDTAPDEDGGNDDFTEQDQIEAEAEDLEREEEEAEHDYPHTDDAGDPIAGFLLGSEEHQPLVILVRPSADQSAQDAMEEEGTKHPEHRPGNLDEATKLLGHSPLTSEDN